MNVAWAESDRFLLRLAPRQKLPRNRNATERYGISIGGFFLRPLKPIAAFGRAEVRNASDV
jgi:hypothetical protein